MEAIADIKIRKTNESKLELVDWDQLEFGKYISDHMFVCDYKNGQWQMPEIKPMQNLSLSPAALGLHYGQSIFEGMKAFRMKNGKINIFRIEKHFERLTQSLERMCMPPLPFELFKSALESLVRIDKAWLPSEEGTALYLRPFLFATEERFGVKISEEYKFVIITGPVPALYQKPIKVKVERKFIRAAKGGTGYAKCAGNYGGAFYPTQIARSEGFDQVIWTDAHTHEYFEESGTMNLMFVIDDKLITPPLSDTILDGITRDSLLTIAKDSNIQTEERPVSIHEFLLACEEGKTVEVFGAGTAAVVAPISVMGIDGTLYHLGPYTKSSMMSQLKSALEAIRCGAAQDKWDWNSIVE